VNAGGEEASIVETKPAPSEVDVARRLEVKRLSTPANPTNPYATNTHTADAYPANAYPSISIAATPTHTPVPNTADANATVVATVVVRRRVTVTHVPIATRCYGCGGSSRPISIA
jgi:hypothetical protein